MWSDLLSLAKLITPIAKDDSLADVDQFAQNQQGTVGCQIALMGDLANQAAYVDMLFLAAAWFPNSSLGTRQ